MQYYNYTGHSLPPLVASDHYGSNPRVETFHAVHTHTHCHGVLSRCTVLTHNQTQILVTKTCEVMSVHREAILVRGITSFHLSSGIISSLISPTDYPIF